MATACASPAGPVHLNFPFRDPLEPLNVPSDQIQEGSPQYTGVCGRPAESPYISCKNTVPGVAGAGVEGLAADLVAQSRGIIVCGPGCDHGLATPVTDLSSQLRYPVLADCLSQVRCGEHDLTNVIGCYDAFISTAQAERLKPEVVIRFGAWPVSKPLCQYLERHRDARHLLVEESRVWRDPSYLAAELWQADPADFCNILAQVISTQPELKIKRSNHWLETWQKLAGVAAGTIAAELRNGDRMFEGRVFAELAELLPSESILFAGNSMPVRDMDTFFPARPRRLHFMANRGTSGIDGVVSTALGTSSVSAERMVLVLGDISFYHDMNGLLAAQRFGLKATIIVINNNGGGIFSFLPQAAHEDVFETYFGTPHGLTFKAAAEQYGLEYSSPAGWPSFREAVTNSLQSNTSTLIEIATDRQANYQMHRKFREAVAAALQRMGR
jgi:2-succinyl-5-enolpyruvyl-6-hydroxy-3-cyclohexene-1-carboxylate synthase